MPPILRTVCLVAAALVLGFVSGLPIGWHLKGQSVDAKSAKADRQALTDLKVDVAQQITDHTAKLQAQQDESAALYAQQQLMRTESAGIRLEIEHAVFTPDAPAGIAPSCPDPSGSAEFERLYGAAATGRSAAHPGSAGAGGVP